MRTILLLTIIILVAILSTANVALADDIANALVVFAEAGDLEKVRYLVLEKGAKANSRDIFGRVALIEAAGGGHLPVIKFLIDQGADVNIRGSVGYTPLMKAIDAGHLEVVKYLGTKGADIGLRDSFGNLPLDLAEKGPSRAVYNHLRPIYARFELTEALLQAAAKGHLSDVKRIIAAGIPVNAQANDGFTPLIAASGFGQLQIVQWLLNNGAKINLASNSGVTPLYTAVKNRHKRIVEYLLDQGADLESRDNGGPSVVDIAKRCGDSAIYKLIMAKRDKEIKHKKCLEDYMDAKEAREKYRRMKPGSLSSGEMIEIIKASDRLLAYKKEWIDEIGHIDFSVTNPNVLDRSLVYIGDKDLKQSSYEVGASMTRLMMAVLVDDKEQTMSLLAEGADPNESNGIGETALFILAGHYRSGKFSNPPDNALECARILIQKGAAVNSTDIAGWTPLMWAAFNGDVDMLKLLLENGADPKIASQSGHTALSLAKDVDYPDIVKALNRHNKSSH
ncbi:MAG: ankyrin repeat domain-containing protein [Smithella sp.]